MHLPKLSEKLGSLKVSENFFDCTHSAAANTVLLSRFAPHLEKCMGMGRNSSRIASRRLANSANKDKDHDHDGGGGEDEDEDWIEPSKAVGNRRKVRLVVLLKSDLEHDIR